MLRDNIANVKNQWLYSHVEVNYPTDESVAGRVVYQSSIATRSYKRLVERGTHSEDFEVSNIYHVDFHRLTIAFALLQSTRWPGSEERALIVEFLSQIIYSEPCRLFLGYEAGDAIAAAIVTQQDNMTLISDIVAPEGRADAIINGLCTKLNIQDTEKTPIFIES
jgi:hypothetical protein